MTTPIWKRDTAPAPGPRVIRADDHGELVPPGLGRAQARRQIGAFDEADLGLAGQHCLGHVGRIDRGEGDGRPRVQHPQRGQPARQQVFGHGHAGRDAEPGLVLTPQRGDPGVQGRGRVDRGLGPARDQGAGRGEPGSARGPFDQGQAQLALQVPDAGAGGGLGNAVFGGGTAQAALPRDRQQQVERGQVGHPGRQGHKHRL